MGFNSGFEGLMWLQEMEIVMVMNNELI